MAFTDAVLSMHRSQNAVYGQSATYAIQGGSVAVSIKARVAPHDVEINDESGVSIVKRGWDIVVIASDLETNGVAFLPQTGDKLTLADGRVFEITDYGGMACYEYADSFGLTLRIHARII